jgi:vacuolar-type H+-ATPase subunit E/Vma4
MRIKKNGKIITLTEGDLKRIVKRTLSEQEGNHTETLEKVRTKIMNLEKIASAGTSLEDLRMVLEGLTKELDEIVDMLNSLPGEYKGQSNEQMSRVDRLLRDFNINSRRPEPLR